MYEEFSSKKKGSKSFMQNLEFSFRSDSLDSSREDFELDGQKAF